MGIDVYLRWELQTDEERDAQITGFSIGHGHVGYLREAYHGEPYATMALLPECFAEGASCEPQVLSAATLRERLPQAMKLALQREREVYKNPDANEDSPAVRSFAEFVALAERLEAQGQEVSVVASW